MPHVTAWPVSTVDSSPVAKPALPIDHVDVRCPLRSKGIGELTELVAEDRESKAILFCIVPDLIDRFVSTRIYTKQNRVTSRTIIFGEGPQSLLIGLGDRATP